MTSPESGSIWPHNAMSFLALAQFSLNILNIPPDKKCKGGDTMTTKTIDSLIKERADLINTMYDCSDKLLAALQTGDLINAERYDYMREGCWDQIKYIDEKINQTLRQTNKSQTFRERALGEMRTALGRLAKTSKLVLSSAVKIRNQVIQSTARSKGAEKTTEPKPSTTITATKPTKDIDI
ncbi:MAG: hypothetical protein A3F16_01405 [Deltaproteobacteria bacterium RIFCSPHIGHO2_12_FULL_43_9]|nr:MAG: hypothetical protein A3F16_01405 [Deltaproteobacteria bacterium RIFCSPHIGHO2_12_FULL_43_9]